MTKVDKLTENSDEKLLDKRIIQRNITKKLISKEDYKAYLSKLKDESDQCESATVEEDDPAQV
ncbi:MAG: hypothetical protein A2Z91_00320 [Deltaproteobacteria bacterium GWA2_38_16]|nr:MAG: hypothetical protein A2Z91_00320 [Deltaproteobacteria bacterium GWA2_38_16]OGQ03547.1 MAG: hypothetical protein A3D19_01725 [Deltaproteobacteria bacterium RIFCSPHIGHO2_02_FULL_38_15]OGQ33271.1 MAG: hypothetical protein A3A72_04840 [Deltaproteobacteria bacterium RIFCSPLOWO2_01_FULL_38_9]OGQ59480.1 MAG: hypothetical protein A3G92_02575 [Deltaproteobacteria bacterium RIFCSPLOWO2_12_FULL_38_8]HBQ21211.1 hypothetical protein [Deltaproteobacteria bacterium]